MIRSVVVSIAVCKFYEVDRYYIFQDSTDRLEQLFGRLRMMQRSNRNFDAVGLADRIIGLMSVARFLDQHPELDAGSRKLSGDIKDHVNPATWKGSTDPSKVNLGIAWKQGATLAAAALTADGAKQPTRDDELQAARNATSAKVGMRPRCALAASR